MAEEWLNKDNGGKTLIKLAAIYNTEIKKVKAGLNSSFYFFLQYIS